MHTSKELVKISSQTNGLAFLLRQNFNESIIYIREPKNQGILAYSHFFYSLTPYPLNYELIYRKKILYALGSKGQNDLGNQSHCIYSKDVPLRREVIKPMFLNTPAICAACISSTWLSSIPYSSPLEYHIHCYFSTNFPCDVTVFYLKFKILEDI